MLINFIASAYATGSISGKVTRQGRTNHSSLITFELRNPPETTPIASYQPSNDEDTNKAGTQITTASDGSYTLINVPAGIYNLSAKASNSLRKNYVLIQVTDGQTTSNIDLLLKGGDANDDNSIATADMIIVSNAWLSHPGSPNWDPRADFNADNSIGTSDMLILQSNWLKNGFEPQPAITSPQDNSIVTSSPITVSGTIDYNNTSVVVNGTTATVANNIFTAAGILLTEGQNTIGATATNTMSNKNADFILVTLDTIAPTIAITSPEDGSKTNTETITVSGTIDDNQANVTVNGNSATVSNGTFTANNIALTQGSNTITANATDLAGHSSSDSITVILDQDPPAINIYTPHDASTTRSNIVYGRVSNDTQTVTVNGTSAEILSDFSFIARPTLTAGANTITVQATDYAGNTNQSSVAITHNTQTPKVTITSPLDNSEQNISPINVGGTNTTDLSFICVNTSTALIDGTNFTAEGVTLDPKNTTLITAIGYDANNNEFQDAIVVTSSNLVNYELTKVSGDVREDDPNRPSAGLTQILKVKLDKNNQPALNEEIQFRVTQGQGTLSSQSSFTDVNGEAQITLTTDTNSDITNQVECYPSNNSLVKTTFYVDTKPGSPSILTKITDDSATPVPGATIPLIVKLSDSSNNIIQGETINFQIVSGDGTLSSPTAVTTNYGEAKVNLTCSNSGLATTQIQASSQTVPSLVATFNITTSALSAVTVDDVIAKVNLNDSLIQDIKADIAVTSNAPFLPSTMQLKIWQKGDKQKVQEISPNPQIKIRPPIQTSTENVTMQKEIISYDPSTNVYAVKTKETGQIEEYPYQVIYVDYNKGVELKSEYYTKDNDLEMVFVNEAQDFIQIGDVWVLQRLVETTYEGQSRQQKYQTENVYTNIQINTGIPDSEFQ